MRSIEALDIALAALNERLTRRATRQAGMAPADIRRDRLQTVIDIDVEAIEALEALQEFIESNASRNAE